MSARTGVLLAIGFLYVLSPVSAAAQVDCSLSMGLPNSTGGVFNLSSDQFTDSELGTAIGYWSRCPGYETDLPQMVVGGSGGIPVRVTRLAGRTSQTNGRCADVNITIVNGQITSVDITVWTQLNNGTSCHPLTDEIAHELGHALGLADADHSDCRGHIMGHRISGSTRIVRDDDCAIADDTWEVPNETVYSDPWCDAYCWTSCVNNVCPDGRPDTGCPILIDMENDGIHLTGLDDPVWFDIDADGAPDLMSWTNRGEGLLALDRDGNGSIDSGAELFGNYTRLSDGTRALNGYLALAELDTWAFGGNGDDSIDSSDEAFGSLRMWSDRNHDGVSQPGELQALQEAGIRRIALDYKRSNRADRYGNEFRFLGRAWKTGRNGVERPVLTWDVFFLVVP